MAQRRAIHTTLQENIASHLTAKSHIAHQAEPVKRAALGDLGNKLQAAQKTNNTLKQNAHLGPPPENVTKKGGSILPSKKDVIQTNAENNGNLKNPSKNFKRQESILKNVPKNITTVPKTISKKLPIVPNNYLKKPSINNPDENIKNDPHMVPEYLLDIFTYLREREGQLAIKSDFLEGHESTPRMRTILVNWLVEVHLNFKFNLDTLHLCIGIIDRYLQENKKVGRNTLQLVGTSAMLIASKYEEIYIPDLEDFEYICDNTFSKRQILQMEIDILKKLDFSLGRPMSIQFLRRYTKIAQSHIDDHNLGKYILELALMEHELSHIRPSLQAAAACCLSMGITNDVMDLKKLWTPTLVHYTSYEYQDFRSLIAELALLIVKSEKSKYQVIRKKYAAAKYGKISLSTKLNGPLIRKLTLGKKVV